MYYSLVLYELSLHAQWRLLYSSPLLNCSIRYRTHAKLSFSCFFFRFHAVCQLILAISSHTNKTRCRPSVKCLGTLCFHIRSYCAITDTVIFLQKLAYGYGGNNFSIVTSFNYETIAKGAVGRLAPAQHQKDGRSGSSIRLYYTGRQEGRQSSTRALILVVLRLKNRSHNA